MAQRAGLAALAAAGDPVAGWLRGSPRTDVYDCYERLRTPTGIYSSPTGFHAVTSRALCDRSLRDRRLGVRRADGASGFPDAIGGRQARSALGGSFVELDPPDHTRLRRLVAPAFRPGAIDSRRADLQRVLDRTLAAARAGSDDGPIDLMSRVAYPFPIAVVSSIFGIPEPDTRDFARLGAVVGRALDGIRTQAQARALRAVEHELTTLFTRLLDERVVDPRDDLLTTLSQARQVGLATAEDAVYTAELLLITGFETTTHLIGNGVAALLRHPGTWQQVVARPDLAADVVEETLRWDPPVQATGRIAHTDLELGATSLRRDSVIMIMTAAANRDPSVYRDPGVFRLDRRDEPDHLAFSAGIHYCLGAGLARCEGALVFRTLAERFPDLRLAPGAQRRAGSTIRGFATLPVALTPVRARRPTRG